MPKVFSLAEQHRQNMGNHTNWLDDKQETQQIQNERVVNLSRYAGDSNKRRQAQVLLQLIAFLSLIQNTTTASALRRVNGKPDEYGLADIPKETQTYPKKDDPALPLMHNTTTVSAPRRVNEKPGEYSLADIQKETQTYPKKAYPAQLLMQDRPVKSLEKKIVKRHIEAIKTPLYYLSADNDQKQKLFVLVKKDFHLDVDDDIYKLAMRKSTPGEIASIQRLIKQNRLRENGALATEETTRLVKMFDEYVVYKSALNALQYSLTRKTPKSLLLEKASELYGLAGDAKEVEDQRLALKVQIYHLEKLIKDNFDIVYRPFLLTANPKNSDGSIYEAVESELAGKLIEQVVISSHGVPEDHTIAYGPAYQARKSIIAYALYVSGIHSADQLAIKNTANKLYFYKELLHALEEYMKEDDESILAEMANHFYFSLFNHYLANPNINMAISDEKVKQIGDLTQNDKIEALIYYFNSDIEVRYKNKKSLSEFILFVAQEIVFSGNISSGKFLSKTVFSKNKMAGKFAKQNRLDKKSQNSFDFRKARRNKKGMQERVKKPKRSDFPDDGTYLQAKLKYEKYIKERVALRSNYDRERRRKIASDKIKQLENTHNNKIIQESSGGFTLTTAQNDRGRILVLSAHAWSDKYTTQLRLPKNRKIFFLGPDGKVLLEAPEKDGLLPTSWLVAGSKHPQIFSSFTDEGIRILAKKEIQSKIFEQAKNYKLKYYDKTPDEEIKLAVIENRLKVDATKMDFLTVDELAGEKKLSDVMNLMKKDQMLQDYDKVIFYACREVKQAGVMKAGGLNEGYEIIFIDIPLPVQIAGKRSVLREIIEGRIEFDGYYIFERFEIEGGIVTPYLEGITPYRKYPAMAVS